MAFIHLLISALVAGASAALVWLGWYAYPYADILHVDGLYKVIIIVDIVCGPLLTFILANPNKSRLETTIDLSLVAIIQLAALIYGLHSLYSARPVITAFEKDRYVIITANEVIGEPDTPLPFMTPRLISIRPSQTPEDNTLVLSLFLQGVQPPSLPSWWQDYAKALPLIRAKLESQTLSVLIKARPDDSATLEHIAQKHQRSLDELGFLPFAHKKNMDWIAIVNQQGEIIDYANIDGFLQQSTE
ncbi:MAG: fimb protein [Gammaproteobacteria bacterium]|nr:MAG: fimb protein [Gammaproteobacteria bacterium]